MPERVSPDPGIALLAGSNQYEGRNARRGITPAVSLAISRKPGFGRTAGGRSNIRFGLDSDGELYILSKSDGMIRSVVGATAR